MNVLKLSKVLALLTFAGICRAEPVVVKRKGGAKTKLCLLIGGMLLASAGGALAAVRYVDANSANPGPPYTSWGTAAMTVQQAVDAAAAGDEIVVTNGAYATGGRVVTNQFNEQFVATRVTVDKPLIVRSVNGPQVTIILGYQVPGTTNGDGAIRCVYLASGASLSGFTLTNGGTRSDGEQSGGGVWCASETSMVSNCVVVGNSASYGGGVYRGTINNCTLTGNQAVGGGGGAFGTSGTTDTTLNNCTLTGNSAAGVGGGAESCTLNNCTVTGNSAGAFGGGTADGFENNCIIYFNTSMVGSNFFRGTLNYCCTMPLPPDGIANIPLSPQLASASHLSAASPCRGAGSAAYTTGTDIDGEAWAIPPSIGCDEYNTEAVTRPLSAGITASLTNVAVGYPIDLTALIEGEATASTWNFGDGLVSSNQPYATHAWAEPGNYPVVLRAYNESQAAGISATATVHIVSQPIHYVAADSGNPLTPYTSWATAATNIQDAIDAASVTGALVLVTNGAYATGGRVVTNQFNQKTAATRVTVDKPLTLRSVNGPRFTVILGAGIAQCVNLAAGATLSGFTLTNGVDEYVGGVNCEAVTAVVSNCVLVGNSAPGGAYGTAGGAYGGTLNNCTLSGNSCGGDYGASGGAYKSTLNNCILSGNSAPSGAGGGAVQCSLNNCTLMDNSAFDAGGAESCTLNNCTLTRNSALVTGGASDCTLNNCIVYFNTGGTNANYDSSRSFSYCCTTPKPTDGLGNISLDPLFLDQAGGNLRLQSNSPCINAGNNAYTPSTSDLDGRPRVGGGTVDIGAFEFQGIGIGEFVGWLQQFGLPTDGSADYIDSDADGMNNWQEWRCGTDPINARSALLALSPFITSTNVMVRWQSIAGVSYFLERSTSLKEPPNFAPLVSNIPGQSGTTIYTDTSAVGPGPFFYRVGVR